MNLNFEDDKSVCTNLARFYAPMRSGNLRYNAIQSYITTDGFIIVYSLNEAYYIYFLEEGTKITSKHKGFISNITVPAIASYLNAKYNDVSDMKKYYEENAILGGNDIYMQQGNERMISERNLKLLESLNLNVPKLAETYDWQHNQNNEIYYEDFIKRKF
ncbi:MAG: hypothetical protein M0R51_08070 [Clostridia bacterium]|jgi:hypothetical protein|nr:hypothetical protein [Clostridia bacterium]